MNNTLWLYIWDGEKKNRSPPFLTEKYCSKQYYCFKNAFITIEGALLKVIWEGGKN